METVNEVSARFISRMTSQGARECSCWERGEVSVFISVDPAQAQWPGWHLSASCPDRYPTWDEIADARYQLIPNEVMMVMVLPPREDYVNVHQTTLHLHEIEVAR